MDPLKEAFDKIKQEMFFLKEELFSLHSILDKANQENLDFQNKLTQELTELAHKVLLIQKTSTNLTIPTQNPTHSYPLASTPTHIPTHQQSPESPINQDTCCSTGSGGVPTDKPTNQQTNQQTDKSLFKGAYNLSINEDLDSFERASEILDSLDSLKREIRLKFKRLTSQEMLIFSTLYNLEEQNIEEISYKTLAQYLRLSESSIRDYITKLKLKGIPISKMRLNNKKIVLKISSDLKKIATLSTIMKLRDL